MRPTARAPLRSTVLIFAILLCAAIAGTAPAPLPPAPPQKPAACTAPEYRQFDFWAGDWDVFDLDKPGAAVARAHVDAILDGCVLREDYQDNSGTKGQSFSLYDTTRSVWHQTWVTNRGRLLMIEGKLQAGEMVLTGSDLTAEGNPRTIRGVWKPVEGGVRETAVLSLDAGKTWQPWFDLVFRPHKP
jgi:hypothetical protein